MKNIDFLPKDRNNEEAENKKSKAKNAEEAKFTNPETSEIPKGILQNFLFFIKGVEKNIAGRITAAASAVRGDSGAGGAKWGKSGIMGTNLIKNEVISFFNWRKKLYFLISLSGAAILIIVLAYVGLFIWEKEAQAKDEILLNQIKTLNQQITEAESYVKDILKFQKKLKLASGLLEQHIYWTNFFTFLEENTLADIYYFDFSGDTGGEYQLSAAAKSFSGITRQLKIFKNNNNVEDVKTSGGQAGEAQAGGQNGSISFQMDLKVKPEIFYK